MSAVDTLKSWGIVRPTDVIEIATTVGLDLASACVLLEKESSGGQNVWGRDAVQTDGAYTPGGPVTMTNYRAYRRSVEQGRAGQQGVGPCQLTWRGYQDAADKLGGCWVWENNVAIGFGALRDLARQYGRSEGWRRYNGDGPAAQRYALDALDRLARWSDRLGVVPAASKHVMVEFGDRGPEVLALQTFARRVFPGYAPDLADGKYGPDTARFVAEFQRRVGIDGDGRNVGPKTLAMLARFGY